MVTTPACSSSPQSVAAVTHALHVRATKLTQVLCGISGAGETKRKCCRELAPQIAEGKGGKREKNTAGRTAEVLDGLRGLYSLNMGEPLILSFLLNPLKKKNNESLENVVKLNCALFNFWYISLGSKLRKKVFQVVSKSYRQQ